MFVSSLAGLMLGRRCGVCVCVLLSSLVSLISDRTCVSVYVCVLMLCLHLVVPLCYRVLQGKE